MNKMLRIILGVVVLVALVAIGLGGTAWADKLNVGTQQASTGGSQNLTMNSRPHGTVSGYKSTTNATGSGTGGGCSSASLSENVGGNEVQNAIGPCGLTAALMTALPNTVKTNPSGTMMPGTLIEFSTGPLTFTYSPALPSGKSVEYWNGTAWVTLTPDGTGQYTIPAGAPTPIYVVVVSS